MSQPRIRSIRSKDDPQKPCNVAYREGREAKEKGLSEEACPYDGGDTYSAYLRWHWMSGYNPLLNCISAVER